MLALPSFKQRCNTLELMDDLSIQGAELEQTLEEIETINARFGGYAPSIEAVASLLPKGQDRLTVLDVGTGGADYPIQFVDWGRRNGVTVEVVGIDLAETTVAYAAQRCADHETIRIELADLFDLDPARRFDVVHAAMVLHHFVGDNAARAIAHMHRHATIGVVINDLHRHPAAWAGIRVYTAAVSKNRLVKNDAPLSVLRGFTRNELGELCARASVPAPNVRWRPMFRWQATIASNRT